MTLRRASNKRDRYARGGLSFVGGPTNAVPGERSQRVVIITALSLECSAVCQHLTERHQTTHPKSGTVYEHGSFRPENGSVWDVLVVEAGAGNVSTAVEVERAISFFNPRLALFVGVAGGLKDVRLGDVVAASKVYAYESGKEKKRFEARPDIQVPSYRLAQRARAEIRSELWNKRIKGKASRRIPRAWIGPMAAGEKVVASTRSVTHRLLKEHYPDALAVEMEGYGFLHAIHQNPEVDALVIRGISDLIDRKSKADARGSQQTAAQAASGFAFELLAHLDGGLSGNLNTISTSLIIKAFEADPRIDELIQDVKLGDWQAAAYAALRILPMTDRASGRNEVFEALLAYQELPDDDDRFWGANHTLEICASIAPWLMDRSELGRMADHENFSIRSSAASICMNWAHSAPHLVPLDIVLKLSVYDEDWYVEAPASAALKAMARPFPEVLGVFYIRLRSKVAEERARAAYHIRDVASKEPHLLDAEQLSREKIRLEQLNDTEASKHVQFALSKVRRSPRKGWYRYGF